MAIKIPIEAPSDNPECRPVGDEDAKWNYSSSKKYGQVRHSDMLSVIRERRGPRTVHSDGFLAVGLIWDCKVSGHKWSNTMEKFCLSCGVDR